MVLSNSSVKSDGGDTLIDGLRKELASLQKKERELQEIKKNLTKDTKDLKKKRDEENKKFSELIELGKKQREERNSINEEIYKYKALRDKEREKLKILKEKAMKLKEIREKNFALCKESPERVIRTIEHLEWKLETTVMKLDKEKKIVDRIRELKENYKISEEGMDADVRTKIDVYHREVSKRAEESKKCHERMIYYFDRAREVKEVADRYHNALIEKNKELDQYYGELRDTIRKINELSDKIKEIKTRKIQAW